MYNWVLKRLLVRFVQHVPQKELVMTTTGKRFNKNQQLLGKIITNRLAVCSTTDTLIKIQSFVDVIEIEDYEHLLMEGYVQGPL